MAGVPLPLNAMTMGDPLADRLSDSMDSDSFDSAGWEDEIRGREEFLNRLTATHTHTATHAAAAADQTTEIPQPVQPAAKPTTHTDEIRGLDDDDDDAIDAPFASMHLGVTPPAAGAASETVLVPSLFDLCVSALGHHFHAIAEQDIRAVLPPGTLTQAIQAVRKAGLIEDTHLPLLFRTLSTSKPVHSRDWLEKDCGLERLVSSTIEAETEDDAGGPPEHTHAPHRSPSASPTPTSTNNAKAKSAASAVRPSPSPPPAHSPVMSYMSRFAPLRSTPGVVSSGGMSLNTASLARAAKEAKLRAQIDAGMRAPMPTSKSVAKKPIAATSAGASIRTRPRAPIIPKEFILASGELLDLHAQHRISVNGFKLLTGLMAYTRKVSSGELVLDDSAAAPAVDADDGIEFTADERRRLAAFDLAPDLRAMVRPTAAASLHALALDEVAGIPRSMIDLARRFGIWRPVNVICLDISFSSIDSRGLQLIARQCPNLLKVNICGCDRLTNVGLSDLARHCKQVQVLLMEVLPCLDDSAVQDVIHGMKQLLSLDVGSCKKLTNVSFQMIGTHGKTLKRLSAAGCHQMTDFDVEDLAKGVSLLSLSLRACGKITNAAMVHLVSLSKRKKKCNMRGLETLDLGGCVRLTDGSINAICAAYGSSLTHLDLRGLNRITNRCIDAIIAHCRVMKEVNIAACEGITEEKIESVRHTHATINFIR